MTHSSRKATIRAYARARGVSYQQAIDILRRDARPASGELDSVRRKYVDADSSAEPLMSPLPDPLRREAIDRFVPFELRHLANNDLDVAGKIYVGTPNKPFAYPTHTPGGVIGGTLTNHERAMIERMEPSKRAGYLLLKRIDEEAENAVLLSQLQTLRHQTAMSIIRNIR